MLSEGKLDLVLPHIWAEPHGGVDRSIPGEVTFPQPAPSSGALPMVQGPQARPHSQHLVGHPRAPALQVRQHPRASVGLQHPPSVVTLRLSTVPNWL